LLLGLSIILAAALATALVFLWRTEPPAAAPVTRYEVPTPANTLVNLANRPAVALSPDGLTLAFVALENGKNRLYLRKRNENETRAVAGSEGATHPVFSPDSRWLAFFSENENTLKKASLDGSAVSLGKVPLIVNTRGLTWLNDDLLVYAPDTSTGLVQVSANGGEPKPISTLLQSSGERTHRWPHALPGGKAVLFTVGTQASPDDYDNSNVEALVLATGERRVVLKGARMAFYVRTGHLLFARGGSLYAVRFDPNRLATEGPSIPVLLGIAGDQTTGAAHFSVANDGTLAYLAGSSQGGSRRLVWVDRQGNQQPLDLPPGNYLDPRISPDGTRVAVISATSDNADVWIHDFSRKTFTRMTFGGRNATPIWSADGKNIYYVAIAASSDKTNVFRRPADGSRNTEALASLDGEGYLTHLLPDGSAILSTRFFNRPGPLFEIVHLALNASAKPAPLVATPFSELGGVVSPDNRFLAYSTSESGRPEVYVRDFMGSGGRWQISTDGGEEPHWSPDGRELYYRNNDLFKATAVDPRTAFQFSAPKTLFTGAYNFRSSTLLTFDVDPKGGRFLMIRPAGEEKPTQVRVILNWFEELKATFQ
jgi:serine/threonine-protein kinase